MPTGIRVVVVDDHHLFVRGLELLLPEVSEGVATVVASTGDAAYAAGVARHAAPDLVLVDLHMPEPGGLAAVEAVRRAAPRARVVAMSGDDDPALAAEALRHGAVGFVPKSSDAGGLFRALLAVLDGWAVLPQRLLGAVVEQNRRQAPHPVAGTLGDTERELLRLIVMGASTAGIAARMHVSERTVKRMTAALLRRLRVSSRAEAALLAGSAGLLHSDMAARVPGNGPLNPAF
ncbi:response regulator transcription factor [Actinoplanes sp. DH11]|uniref:response regulator transcription factor n=1 Tax=Actinoplanes sp. DH11 TaxID=2857011 RepID=UPI001E2908BF|nr:response regulator transcription factor [Actinoplanes sp. DH11]